MTAMFDVTLPAIQLLDTPRLQRLLQNNTNTDDRQFIIENWIAAQNRDCKSIITPLASDTFANVIAMETFPKLTSEEFATLMGALASLGDPGLLAIVAKLKQYEGLPSLQTCFDAEGFSGEVLQSIPELARYKCKFHLTAQIRVEEDFNPLEQEATP